MSWPKASRATFIAKQARIHHSTCGGRVHLTPESYSKYTYARTGASWKCGACRQSWTEERLLKFSDEEIGDRFEMRGNLDPDKAVLVWAPFEGRLHTKLVPENEAQFYTRVTEIK